MLGPVRNPKKATLSRSNRARKTFSALEDFEDAEALPPELMFDGEPVEVEAAATLILRTCRLGTCARRPPEGIASKTGGDSALIYSADANPVGKFVHAFDDLTDLPEDLTAAFEQYKQVILTHKQNGWEQVSQADMLASLESLKALVTSA